MWASQNSFCSSCTPDWLEQEKFTRSEWPVKQTNDKLLAEVKKRKIDEKTFCFQDINRVPLSLWSSLVHFWHSFQSIHFRAKWKPHPLPTGSFFVSVLDNHLLTYLPSKLRKKNENYTLSRMNFQLYLLDLSPSLCKMTTHDWLLFGSYLWCVFWRTDVYFLVSLQRKTSAVDPLLSGHSH